MYTFLIVLHVFVSIILILAILLQAGRGGGLSEMFGGSSTQTIFGTSTTKFLTRATAVCAVIFLITCLSLAVLSSRRSRSLMESKEAISVEFDESREIPQEGEIPAEGEVPAGEGMFPEDEREPILPERMP